MRARNGATFAELALLRALRIRGGEVSFADLSKTHIRSVEKVLKGMLPAKSRPSTVGRRTLSGKVRAGRAGLIGKTFRDGQVYYHIAPAGLAAASFAGPWTQKTLKWAVEWTPSRVEVAGAGGVFVGRFSASGVEISGVMATRKRPDLAAWRDFRRLMKTSFAINVPAEAVPDFVRLTEAFASPTDRLGGIAS
jgi:hypothetical protein